MQFFQFDYFVDLVQLFILTFWLHLILPFFVLKNLYFYASERTEEYRRHLLMETLLVPRLVLPYLDQCVIHATILNTRAEAYSDVLEVS